MKVFLQRLISFRLSLAQRIQKRLTSWTSTGTFSVLTTKAKKWFGKRSSKLALSAGSGTYFTYENILLSLYVEIVNTGNYLLVGIDNKDEVKCYEAWEQIVMKNSKAAGGSYFNAHMDLMKSYSRLVYERIEVRVMLTNLLFFVDDEMISILKSKGYKIDTSGGTKYVQSLNAALLRSNNINSKIKSIEERLSALATQGGEHTNLSLGELLANLSFGMGSLNVTVSIGQDITLSMYNEYKRLIKKKAEQLHSHHGRA